MYIAPNYHLKISSHYFGRPLTG